MQDKVVIITGGTRGIGAGITQAFYEKGARVVVNYNSNDEAAKTLKKHLHAEDDRFLLVKSDISTKAGREKLFNDAIEHFNSIDTLVNNAGVSARKGFLKSDEDDFDLIINTNLKGPIFLAQSCANHMIENKIKGNIINICSISAYHPNAVLSYCAAKAGLLMATKRMALKLSKYHIRVNSVTPGTIKSDMNRYYWKDNPQKWNEITQRMPLQRGGEPKEVASAVVYLVSEDANFITGVDLIVDGGWSLKPSW